MKKRIRIQGMLIVFAMITIVLLHRFLPPHWKKERPDEFLDVLGIGIILAGFVFRISARGYKEEKSLSGKKLITDGPYTLMRNPMYFGSLMIGTGFITVLVEWWGLLVFLCIFLLIYIPQVKKEEAVLVERFGQKYKDYCKETPRYFPKVQYLLSLRKYLPLKLSWLKKELPSLAAAITCLIVIEIWEDVTLFGSQELFREALELILTTAAFAFIIVLLFRTKEKQRHS
jgi:protein-S-isoprenylcysteine O-methyltransferase Ste14